MAESSERACIRDQPWYRKHRSLGSSYQRVDNAWSYIYNDPSDPDHQHGSIHLDLFYKLLSADLDDDNDGVPDDEDAFPLDASESVDTDGDGIPDGCDPCVDDDGDGEVDVSASIKPLQDNDEDDNHTEDTSDGLDNDGDGSVDEDLASDLNGDGCSGSCSVDDDSDGVLDEAHQHDEADLREDVVVDDDRRDRHRRRRDCARRDGEPEDQPAQLVDRPDPGNGR